MSMFHILFPKRYGFLTWDELGCLARVLGFHVDLFKAHVTDEITVENDGLSIQEIKKMMEYKLLYRPLHHTVNMHTAEWNMSAIRKCLYLLDHRALTFEELHNIRMAYQVYEAGDMKGMAEDQHTLLRTLKMCGRTIAPMKLMHRIKHMKINFEEKGRIQLSEFMDLVLWCDIYHAFNPAEMEYSEGKDDELFKLVDFERLLSHHDDRIMVALDADYIRDECGFERETFGTKRMPKEPPVRNQGRIKQLEDRILCDEFIQATEAARLDKRRYRHLKYEVVASQKRVYRAHAGSIRPRPISVPHLDGYRKKIERSSTACTTAEQAYNSFRKKIRSVPSRGSTVYQSDTYSERPQAEEYVRVSTPRAVSRKEMTEIEKKMESLKFAMTTMESRYLIKKEEEMDEYIPGYKETIANRPSPPSTPEPKPEPKKEIHWTEDVIQDLTNPPFRDPPSHAKKCDARFRGWQPVTKKRGPHFILVSPFYENMEKGIFFQRLYDKSRSQVQHVTDFDFLYRYTHKSQVDRGKGLLSKIRPITAPAVLQESLEDFDPFDNGHAQWIPITPITSSSGREASAPSKGSSVKQDRSSNHNSDQIDFTKKEDLDPEKQTVDQITPPKFPGDGNSIRREITSPRLTKSSSSKISSSKSARSKKGRKVVSAAGERLMPYKSQDFVPDSQDQKNMDSKSNSGYSAFEENLEPYDSDFEARRASGAKTTNELNNCMDEVIPVPPMQHSKAQIVDIGLIGKISLLEKIAESQDLEAKYSQQTSPVKENICSNSPSRSSTSEHKNRNEMRASSQSSVLSLVKSHDSSVPGSPVKKRYKSSLSSETKNLNVSPEQVQSNANNLFDENKSANSKAYDDNSTRRPRSQLASNLEPKLRPHICPDGSIVMSPSNTPPLNTASPHSKMLNDTNIQSPTNSHSSQNEFSSESQKQVHVQEPKTFNGSKSDTNNNSKESDLGPHAGQEFEKTVVFVSSDSNQTLTQPDGKYWRLVERMDKLISNDLKIRLLTVNK